MKISYDFHIHSCLSPCGDDDSFPSDIVGMAALKQLDAIALTDHNTCRNCPAAQKIAEQLGILFIPGMELTTSEEVHVVCLFRTLDDALAFDKYVYYKLLKFPNDENVFGHQYICNSNDEITATEPYLLINATEISFDETYALVSDYNGIMIPAHIDKNTYSVIANLGFIPTDSKFTCAEIKDINTKEQLLDKHPYLQNCVIISDSDAHYLCDINESVNFIEVRERSIDAIFDALTHKST